MGTTTKYNAILASILIGGAMTLGGFTCFVNRTDQPHFCRYASNGDTARFVTRKLQQMFAVTLPELLDDPGIIERIKNQIAECNADIESRNANAPR